LHATRAQFGVRPLRIRWRFWLFTTIPVVLLYFVLVVTFSIKFWGYQSSGLLVFLALVGVQIGTIVDACWNHFEAISSFYFELARRRASDEVWVGDYVESYRHLREHGNAFSILFLEFALGLVLVAAPRLLVAVLAMVLWLLPSTCSWYIGCLLESKLSDLPKR
jgi:hypothetical protein